VPGNGGQPSQRPSRRRLKDRFALVKGDVEFGPLEWLSPEQLDPAYFTLLPDREESFSAKEAAALALIFAEHGELPAEKLN
jgi:hypothetical protein